MRRMAVVLWALALLAGGCSTASRSGTTAPAPKTTMTDAPRTSTTSNAGEINPDIIPTVITIPYVDAVFKVLEHLDGDVSRNLLATGRVTTTAKNYLRAIYNDPLYQQELTIAQQSITAETANVRKPPGDVVVSVLKIISKSPSCIFVSTTADYNAVHGLTKQTLVAPYLLISKSGTRTYKKHRSQN